MARQMAFFFEVFSGFLSYNGPENGGVRSTKTYGGGCGGCADGKRGIGGVSWQTWCVGVRCLPRMYRASHFPGTFFSYESFTSYPIWMGKRACGTAWHDGVREIRRRNKGWWWTCTWIGSAEWLAVRESGC